MKSRQINTFALIIKELINMKLKLFFLIIIFGLLYSCDTSDVRLLINQNKDMDIILDSLSQNRQNFNSEICIISINKNTDTIELEITYSLPYIEKKDIESIKKNIYGTYQYNGNYILVFGSYANVIFNQERKKVSIKNIGIREMDENYIPPTYNPEIFIYYINKKKIFFKNSTWL